MKGYELRVYDKDKKVQLFSHKWFETVNEAKSFMVAQYFFGRAEFSYDIVEGNKPEQNKFIHEGI